MPPMHDGGPMAANDETLPITEYAARKLDGYGLSHLLLMGNTTDFTPLEPQSPDRRGARGLGRVRTTLHRQSRHGRAARAAAE